MFVSSSPAIGAAAAESATASPGLVDGFGRRISYLRLSVTDRCDMRCFYCLPERARFVPRADVLDIEELHRVAAAFVGLGVGKIRVTGGEPLVRRGVMRLFELLGENVARGALRELTLTTNGSLLARHAAALAACGVRRVNVSLDSLDPDRFAAITRCGRLEDVLAGIAAANGAGIQVKVNTVAMRGVNEDELPALMAWAHGQGHDWTLIEMMPMAGAPTALPVLPLATVLERLCRRYTLVSLADRTGGPARYHRVVETGGRLGTITPLAPDFCGSCNRVRLTATGRLYMCLGRSDHLDLGRAVKGGADVDEIACLLRRAVEVKPDGHRFAAGGCSGAPRSMSVTGG